MEQRVCKKHGPYLTSYINVFDIPFETPCPECEKLREQAEEQTYLKELAEHKRRDLVERGVEPEFLDKTFDDYKAETESEKNALRAVKALQSGTIKKVVLLGANGVGKTMLADCLIKEIGGIRITMFELSARIREGFNCNQTEVNTLEKLLRYPLIVIDEVGRTKGSEAERNWLSYLIDKVHTRGKRLMLISNRQTAKHLPPERKGDAFEYFFDNDVISRLRQDTWIVEVTGRDRRATVAAI